MDKYFRNLVSENWFFLFQKHWPQYVSVINEVVKIEFEWSKMFFDFSKFNFTNSITNTMRLRCPLCGYPFVNQQLSEGSLERACLDCPFRAQCDPYIVQENDCFHLKQKSTILIGGACFECGSVLCENCTLSCKNGYYACDCDGNTGCLLFCNI